MVSCLPCIFKTPEIRPLVEQDEATLQRMFPEIPIWVKNPDHDRVCSIKSLYIVYIIEICTYDLVGCLFFIHRLIGLTSLLN